MSIVRQGTLPVGSLDHAITLNVQSNGGSHFETVTDTTPYLHRASPQDVASSMKLKKVVGGTIAWNQLMENILTSYNNNGVTASYSNGVYTFSGTATSDTSIPLVSTAQSIIGHKYLRGYTFGSASTYFLYGGGCVVRSYLTPIIYEATESVPNTLSLRVLRGTNMDGVKFTLNVFDLTQMFGSTIADYIYSLEQAHAGDGVAWFKALFPNAYYSYNAGELMSVHTSAHKTVGFNQWDEEWETGGIVLTTGNNNPILSPSRIRSKNYIPVVPNAVYYISISGIRQSYAMCFYDANKVFIEGGWRPSNVFTIPSNCYYIRFNTVDAYGGTYKNDICINLSSSRNGQYEPYKENTYPLDSDLTLRGIPKLDADNKLYYDGDTYESDGTVTRKYGIRAYTEGDATDGSTMITDGTNTVYKLTTSTTESADAYTQSQRVGATEEFVDGRTVEMPVGNVSEYKRLIQGD